MKKEVTVNIYGRSYPMLTDEADEYTERLANMLNERMAHLKTQKKTLSLQDAAAIISLECVDELIKNKETEYNIRTQISAYAEDASESRAKAEKLQKENEQLKEKVRQLESEIRLRKSFEEEGSTAEQMVMGGITKALGTDELKKSSPIASRLDKNKK